MRSTVVLAAALMMAGSVVLAQAGTNNNSTTQQEVKPKTGRASEILLSPDVNQHITGNVGYTEGATPDVSSYSMPATAGAVSSGAESTAAVTSAEQITRQYVEDRVARGSIQPAVNGEAPPNAFNQGPSPSATQTKGRKPPQ
jgi:hypothetical protein